MERQELRLREIGRDEKESNMKKSQLRQGHVRNLGGRNPK
jgi:hypothetical protein